MTTPLEGHEPADDAGDAVRTVTDGRHRSKNGTAPTIPGGFPRGLTLLLGIAAAVIAVAGMRATAWLIGPLFLALMIVIAAHPVQGWLRRKGWPAWAGTIALIVVVYAGLLALAAVLVVSVGQLATLLPTYENQFNALVASVQKTLAGFGVGPTQIQAATQGISLNSILGVVGGIVSGFSGALSVVVLILALLLFFIADAATFGDRLDSIAADRPHIVGALEGFARGTRSYLLVTTVFGGIVAVLDTAALAIIGVPLAFLWGVLAFITNFIPNIGFIFGLIPPAILALLTGGWTMLIVVVVVYCVLNLVIQSLVQPRYTGASVGLSATVTFVTLLFWAWVLGPLGALLAIPLTLLAKALLVDIDPSARWADALIRTDAKGPVEPEPEPETKPEAGPKTEPGTSSPALV
jgi:predicted PurR-regulated permease PerM